MMMMLNCWWSWGWSWNEIQIQSKFNEYSSFEFIEWCWIVDDHEAEVGMKFVFNGYSMYNIVYSISFVSWGWIWNEIQIQSKFNEYSSFEFIEWCWIVDDHEAEVGMKFVFNGYSMCNIVSVADPGGPQGAMAPQTVDTIFFTLSIPITDRLYDEWNSPKLLESIL